MLRTAVRLLADRAGSDSVDVRGMMPVVGADLEREERMLLRKIARDHQDGFAFVQIGRRGQRVRLAR